MSRAVVLAGLMSLALPAFGQSNWDRYRAARLDTMIAAHAPLLEDEMPDSAQHQLWAFAADYPLLVEMTYTGSVRTVAQETKDFIGHWLQARQIDSSYVNLFEKELLFEEDGTGYWMPVQSGPLEIMEKELAYGARIKLYLSFIGAYASRGDAARWVFLVNEYEWQ